MSIRREDLNNIDFSDIETGEKMEAVHPGKVLKDEFLTPLNISSYSCAKRLDIPTPRINDLCLGKRGISAETALLLAKFFDTTPEFWLNLQVRYDLQLARVKINEKLKCVESYKVT